MRLNFLEASVLLLFGFLTAACNPFAGTGTGNPNNAQQGSAYFSDTLASVACSSISKCHGVKMNECLNAVAPLVTFAPKLGLQESISLAEISRRESNGTLKPDSLAGHLCIDKLQSLTCESGLVVASPMDSAEMLDLDCASVF